jgi:hypothetical protein
LSCEKTYKDGSEIVLPPAIGPSIKSTISIDTVQNKLSIKKESMLLLAFHLVTYCQPGGDANTRTTRAFIDALAAKNGLYIPEEL